MSYDQGRLLIIEERYDVLLEDFIRNYNPGEKTIIFLPGGIGSELNISDKKYRGVNTTYNFSDTIWMDLGLIFGNDLEQLGLSGSKRDHNDHVVVPNRAINSFLTRPYDGTEMFFKERNFNYIVFPYDWRRSIEESANFLKIFITKFKSHIENRYNQNPLQNTTLFCHSMGGLVATYFLHLIKNKQDLYPDNVITAGTPFYGLGSQHKRFYEGLEDLEIIHKKKEMAKIVSSMPGLYEVMFLDEEVYEAYKDKIELDYYPVTLDGSNSHADPYNPPEGIDYPKWVNKDYVYDAKEIRDVIAYPLPEPLLNRFFNIRSAKNENTIIKTSWESIPGNYDPDKQNSPIKEHTKANMGDGTVPKWSAFLAHTHKNKRIDLNKAEDHETLAEHEETLTIVESVITHGKPNMIDYEDKIYGNGYSKISKAQFRSFLEDIKEDKIKKSDNQMEYIEMWNEVFKRGTIV